MCAKGKVQPLTCLCRCVCVWGVGLCSDVQSIHNLGARKRWVFSTFRQSHYIRGSLGAHRTRRWLGVGVCCDRMKISPTPGFDSWSVLLLASRFCTDAKIVCVTHRHLSTLYSLILVTNSVVLWIASSWYSHACTGTRLYPERCNRERI